MRLCCFISLWGLSLSIHATPLKIFKVERAVSNGNELHFLFKGKPAYKQFTLKKPNRVVFDFSNIARSK
jgi:hypothetical protein